MTDKARTVVAPYTDIIEKADAYVISAEMPGVPGDAVEITLQRDVVKVYGKATAGCGSCSDVDYERTFRLTDAVDRDGIKASTAHGVVTVTVPKAAATKPTKIEITHN